MSGPWLKEAMSSLGRMHAADRMPHALLIHAAHGTGGDWLAGWVAQLVLCPTAAHGSQTADRPCGRCASCRHVSQGQHPDLSWTRPLEDSQQIRIEQIRERCAELALTSHQGGYKVAIVDPADSLNRFAANALLKTLEEPPPRTLLVLVAAQPSRLPATLRSRCQRIAVRAPTRAESLEWLTSARGAGEWEAVLDILGEAPLAAAALDPAATAALRSQTWGLLEEMRRGRADPVLAAEQWSRAELPLRLACVENWLTERIRAALAGTPQSAELRATAQPRRADSVINTPTLFRLLDAVRELKAALVTPINRSLALESLLRSLQA
ncbi:MAG TPA: DNA polymerase III subunit delta' [Steroidobacteraceae bacterium]|nr:DNA polymerase III subunit delta' [Steroidobacteraceae bacterium]